MSTEFPELLLNHNRDTILNDLQQKKFGYYSYNGYNEPLDQSKAPTVYFTKETDKDFKQLGYYKNMYFDSNSNIVITFKPLDNLFSSDRKLYILNSNIPNVIDYLYNKGEDIRFHLKNENDKTYTEVNLYTGLEKNNILEEERKKRLKKKQDEEEDYQRQILDKKFNRIDEGGARNKSKKQLKKVKKTKKTKKRTRKQRRKQRSKRMFSIK